MPRTKKIKNMTLNEIIETCKNSKGCEDCPFTRMFSNGSCFIPELSYYGQDILEDTMTSSKAKQNGTTVNEIVLDEFEV